MKTQSRKQSPVLYGLLSALLVLSIAGCRSSTGDRGLVTVGSSEDPEQVVLGKMLVLVLREAGLEVDDRTGVGDRSVLRPALEAGSIDVAWQYTGETWVEHLGHDLPVSDAEDAFHQVRAADALRGITWLAMAPYARGMTLVVLRERAETLELTTCSDLAAHMRSINPDMRLCTPEDVYYSPQGVSGLERVYRFDFRLHNVRLVPFERGYDGLVTGDCDCALGRLADAEVRMNKPGQVVALVDDRGFFQASNLAPVIRTTTLQRFPDLEPRINQLSRVLTHQAMVQLKRQMANKRANPEAVAKRFLKQKGILKRWDPFPLATLTPQWLAKPEDEPEDTISDMEAGPTGEPQAPMPETPSGPGASPASATPETAANPSTAP